MKKSKLILLFFLACLVSACSGPQEISEQEQAFLAMFPDGTFARKDYVKLMTILYEGQAGIFIGESVTIYVENVWRQTIVFPFDFGYRMYYFEDFQWKEAAEAKEYKNLSDKKEIVLYPEDDWKREQFNSDVTFIWPTLENTGKPITVRWVAIGEILEDGKLSGKKVGCYIDIVFEPDYQTPIYQSTEIIRLTPKVLGTLSPSESPEPTVPYTPTP